MPCRGPLPLGGIAPAWLQPPSCVGGGLIPSCPSAQNSWLPGFGAGASPEALDEAVWLDDYIRSAGGRARRGPRRPGKGWAGFRRTFRKFKFSWPPGRPPAPPAEANELESGIVATPGPCLPLRPRKHRLAPRHCIALAAGRMMFESHQRTNVHRTCTTKTHL